MQGAVMLSFGSRCCSKNLGIRHLKVVDPPSAAVRFPFLGMICSDSLVPAFYLTTFYPKKN